MVEVSARVKFSGHNEWLTLHHNCCPSTSQYLSNRFGLIYYSQLSRFFFSYILKLKQRLCITKAINSNNSEAHMQTSLSGVLQRKTKINWSLPVVHHKSIYNCIETLTNWDWRASRECLLTRAVGGRNSKINSGLSSSSVQVICCHLYCNLYLAEIYLEFCTL